MTTEQARQNASEKPEGESLGEQVGTVEEPTELTQEEAEAAMAAGFDSVHQDTALGEAPEPEPEPDPEPKPQEQEAIGEAYDLTPEEVRAQTKRLRKLESRYGSLKDEMDTLKDAIQSNPGGQATNEQAEQMQVLLQNQEGIEASLKEFEELSPLVSEVQHVSEAVAGIQQRLENTESGMSADDVQAMVDAGVTQGMMRLNYPDWEETTKTEDFRRWMLNGGPSEQEYVQYVHAMRNPAVAEQPPEEYLADWETDYPGWWKDRGDDLFSDDPVAAIRTLDRYTDAVEGREAAGQGRRQRQNSMERRLRGNTTPEGVGADPATTLSADEEMARGFARAKGR